MDTAIVFNNIERQEGSGLLIKFRNLIFGQEMDEVGCKIESNLVQNDHFNLIEFDFRDADVIRSKLRRFLGICIHFSVIFQESGKEKRINLIVEKRQEEFFAPLLGYPNINIIVREDEAVVKSQRIYFEKIRKLSKKEILTTEDIAKLSTYVIAIVCFVFFVISFIYYRNSLFGFALSFSTSILALEAYFVIKLFRSKNIDGG